MLKIIDPNVVPNWLESGVSYDFDGGMEDRFLRECQKFSAPLYKNRREVFQPNLDLMEIRWSGEWKQYWELRAIEGDIYRIREMLRQNYRVVENRNPHVKPHDF